MGQVGCGGSLAWARRQRYNVDINYKEESTGHVRRAAFKDGFGGLLFYFIKDEYVVLPVLFVVNTDSYKMVTIS